MTEAQHNPKSRLLAPATLRLFERQLGIASRAQLLASGVHRLAIVRAVKNRVLVRVFSGIYRFGSAPESAEQRLLASTLAVTGSVVSHRTAAWLHGFSGFERLDDLEVSTTTGARARGVLVHHPRVLPRTEITAVRGVPVTREARTLLDLCEVAPELVARALDDTLRRGVVRFDLLERLLRGRSARRKSSRILAALLRERAPEDARAASELESRFLRLLRRAGLPRPRVNQDLLDERGAFLARPDALWEEARLTVFLDGRAFHSSRPEFEKDREQANALTTRGWTVLRYTWRQVTQQGDQLVLELRSVLGRARTTAGPSARTRASPILR